MDEIKLGYRYRDVISGFKGIAIGISHWLYGCTRVGLQPEALDDGKPVDSHWFDKPQLEFVDEGIYKNEKPLKSEEEPLGGPKQDPSRKKDAIR